MGSNEVLDRGGVGEPSASRRKLSPGPGLSAREVAAHQLARIHRATIEIVAEGGYRTLTVRDLVRRAEVSTRAFYEHFSGKEDCFLDAYDKLARRAMRRLVASQSGGWEWRTRARLILDEFIRWLDAAPGASRLALVDVYAATPASLEHAYKAERTFEDLLSRCLARPPGGVTVPPLIIEGVVGGIASIARRRLLSGRQGELHACGDELTEWALGYVDKAAVHLAQLDRRSVWDDTTQPSRSALPSGGDRALILAAVADLTVDKGFAYLTVPRIHSKAWISRRRFDLHFDDVETCFLAALEQRSADVVARATRAKAAAASRGGGVYRAVAAFCDHVSADPFLATVCLGNDFPFGPNGRRSRDRLISTLVETLTDGAPPQARNDIVLEASAGAVWSVFRRYVARTTPPQAKVTATLSYLASAPILGSTAALAAILTEQHSSPRPLARRQ
jgi:AcrR family transcriptional regulator